VADVNERLRQSEERFRLLMESVQDYAIFMLDTEGRIASWNRGAERVKGYSEADVIGRHFGMFYSDEDRRRGHPEEELRRALAEGRYEEEGWRSRKDGTRFWANVIITAVFDRDGTHVGFAKVTRDFTARQAAQLAEQEAVRERARAAEAERAVRLRDEFLSVAAHELRTPLTALQLKIEGLAQQVRRSQVGAHLEGRFSSAVDQVQRLSSLVERLLDVSRIVGGQLTISPETCDFTEVVTHVVDDYRDAARDAGCALTLDASGPLPAVLDRVRIEQVVINLLANAIKYGAGKPVGVEVSDGAGRLHLAVVDEGIGIDAADLPRIFTRFERVAPLQHFAGLGLGLFITRNIVEAHRGTISVTSTLGKGSRFEVDLPSTVAVGA
jgi:PAS domain S-box-containing protein